MARAPVYILDVLFRLAEAWNLFVVTLRRLKSVHVYLNLHRVALHVPAEPEGTEAQSVCPDGRQSLVASLHQTLRHAQLAVGALVILVVVGVDGGERDVRVGPLF